MKQNLLAVLLVLLHALVSDARAYEADIHHATTYALARAVGWPEADALTIASANEGVDQNEHTVAALEMEAIPRSTHAGYVASSVRQAEKNLRFHCFSRTRGRERHLSRDVVEVMSLHFARVPDADEDARSKTTRLIALGVALHCQQDAHSHVEFGGSCGSHPGSCYGHTHESVLDDVVYRVLGKHYFNPDHPGVSGEQLFDALQGTAIELAARLPKGRSRSISNVELTALSDALRSSGIELPDETRRNCNRYIAGKWLFDVLAQRSRTRISADSLQAPAPEIAMACKNPSLVSATVVRIPDPRLPRLNADASPFLVKADGNYEHVREGGIGVFSPTSHAASLAKPMPGHQPHPVRFQLSHWRQVLALPLRARKAHSSPDGGRTAR